MLKIKNSLKLTFIFILSLTCMLVLPLSAEASKNPQLSKSYADGIGNDVIVIQKDGFEQNVSLNVKPVVIEVDSAGTGEVKVAASYAVNLMAEDAVIKPSSELTIKFRIPSVIGEQPYRIVQVADSGSLDYLVHQEENGYAVVTVDTLGEFVILYQPPQEPITSNPWVWAIFGVIIAVVIVLAVWIFVKGAKNKKKADSSSNIEG